MSNAWQEKTKKDITDKESELSKRKNRQKNRLIIMRIVWSIVFLLNVFSVVVNVNQHLYHMLIGNIFGVLISLGGLFLNAFHNKKMHLLFSKAEEDIMKLKNTIKHR